MSKRAEPTPAGASHCCEIPGCIRPVDWSGRGRPGRYCGLVIDGVPHPRLTAYRLANGQAVRAVPPERPAGQTPVTSAYSSLGQLRTELAALAGRIETATGALTPQAEAVQAEAQAAHHAARALVDAAEADRDTAQAAARAAKHAADAARQRAEAAEATAEAALAATEEATEQAHAAEARADDAEQAADAVAGEADAARADTARVTDEWQPPEPSPRPPGP